MSISTSLSCTCMKSTFPTVCSRLQAALPVSIDDPPSPCLRFKSSSWDFLPLFKSPEQALPVTEHLFPRYFRSLLRNGIRLMSPSVAGYTGTTHWAYRATVIVTKRLVKQKHTVPILRYALLSKRTGQRARTSPNNPLDICTAISASVRQRAKAVH